MHTAVREALWFHLAFFLVALPALYLAQGAAYGWTLLWLVIGYNLALPAWALVRGHTEWLWLWLFLLPLSCAQVVPDWVLVEVTRTLVFPDHGSPRIGGAVPVAFMGMWLMALLPLVLIAQSSRRPYLTMGLLSLLVFTFWEWAARPLRLWHGQNVWLVYGVAVYTLLPEVLLGLMTLTAYRSLRSAGPAIRLLGALGVSVFYAGALVISLLLTERLFSPG